MSAHTRMHLTDMRSNTLYVIPTKIAQKYVVTRPRATKMAEAIPAEVVFARLEAKLTKAGALLKGLRTREGLTQLELAKKMHTTQANLSNMENGRRPIGKAMAKRLAKIFTVDFRYFIS